MNRLFAGIYPGGVVYADKLREKGGDYARLAFLSFSSLDLQVEPDCPKELRDEIVKDAAVIQARRGERFNISTCGQQVVLGGP
jgi:hypothetical protein